MTKTPDKIKKGLECCKEDECFGDRENCPYTADPKLCVGVMCADALALIQQLEAQVPHWISVEERLPDKQKCVLVFKQRNSHALWPIAKWHIEIDWRGEDGWSKNLDNGYFDITHWMPLPEPPKEE